KSFARVVVTSRRDLLRQTWMSTNPDDVNSAGGRGQGLRPGADEQRLQFLRGDGGVQPAIGGIGLEDDRNAMVEPAQAGVRFGGDDREAVDLLIIARPAVPDTGEENWRIVEAGDPVGDLSPLDHR